MFQLRFLAALLGFVGASLYGLALALVRRDRSSVAYDYARRMGQMMQPALGVRGVRVEGEEYLHAHRPCIYIVNHQSYFDVPVLASVYPLGTVVIAKKEIRSIPFFGWLFVRTGNILIDRADRQQAVARLREVSDEIRRRGVSVWIFPEGTRGKTPGELLPFKKGAFQMALAAQVPIVPLVLSPMREVIDTERRRIRPGRMTVRVLEPILTAGLGEGSVGELMERAHARMSTALREIAATDASRPQRIGEPAGGA